MARKVRTEILDDLNGKPAAETVRFGLDQSLYEIDLDKRNAAKLRKALLLYTQAARRARRIPPLGNQSRGRI